LILYYGLPKVCELHFRWWYYIYSDLKNLHSEHVTVLMGIDEGPLCSMAYDASGHT